MSLAEKFTSNQNKGLIWKLLCDDGIFATVPVAKSVAVKEDFDRKIDAIARQITTADTIVNLDKRVICEMIDTYKKKEIPLYNAAEISENRQKVFQNEFVNKKKEFDAFNAAPVPDKIDFSDNLDSPIGSEMDKILAEQIAIRENQLTNVLKTLDKEAATKWIQQPPPVPAPAQTNEPKKIKIGENIQIDIKEPPVKLKKVVFADTQADTTQADTTQADTTQADFMALLKKKEPSTIDDMLREILSKQNQILELLLTPFNI
jgi:hypothetical protein